MLSAKPPSMIWTLMPAGKMSCLYCVNNYHLFRKNMATVGQDRILR